MSKEARLEQARRDRQIAIDAARQKADKEIESLLAEIEAEKEPVLRHGDKFVSDGTGYTYIYNSITDRAVCLNYEASQVGANECFSGVPYTFLSNECDDLKAMQEDVTEFVIGGVDEEDEGVSVEMDEDRYVTITDHNDGDSVSFTCEELTCFRKKLQAMEATLKRRQK